MRPSFTLIGHAGARLVKFLVAPEGITPEDIGTNRAAFSGRPALDAKRGEKPPTKNSRRNTDHEE
jgi:hypothetical protein